MLGDCSNKLKIKTKNKYKNIKEEAINKLEWGLKKIWFYF